MGGGAGAGGRCLSFDGYLFRYGVKDGSMDVTRMVGRLCDLWASFISSGSSIWDNCIIDYCFFICIFHVYK